MTENYFKAQQLTKRGEGKEQGKTDYSLNNMHYQCTYSAVEISLIIIIIYSTGVRKELECFNQTKYKIYQFVFN